MTSGSRVFAPRGKCVRVRVITSAMSEKMKRELGELGATVLPLFRSTRNIQRNTTGKTHAVECCHEKLQQVSALLATNRRIQVAGMEFVMPHVFGVQWMSFEFKPFNVRAGRTHQVPHQRVYSLEKLGNGYTLLSHQIVDDRVEVRQIRIEEVQGKMEIPLEFRKVSYVMYQQFAELRGTRYVKS